VVLLLRPRVRRREDPHPAPAGKGERAELLQCVLVFSCVAKRRRKKRLLGLPKLTLPPLPHLFLPSSPKHHFYLPVSTVANTLRLFFDASSTSNACNATASSTR
jgi:hypothetical protein